MADKLYTRVTWENYPSQETPLDEINLNKMDKAIDLIDTRVVHLSGYEERAEAAADEAEQSATNAATSETNAATSETNAGTSAQAASDSADDAEEYSTDAEAWAVGQRNGTDVPSTDETYHNNSKYYAEQMSNCMATADYVPDTATGVVKQSKNITEHIGSNVLKFAVQNSELVYKVLSGGTEPTDWSLISPIVSIETQRYTGTGTKATITAGTKDGTTGEFITLPVITANAKTLTFTNPPVAVFIVGEHTTANNIQGMFSVFLQGWDNYIMAGGSSVVKSGVALWSTDGKTLRFGNSDNAAYNLDTANKLYKVYAICSKNKITYPWTK